MPWKLIPVRALQKPESTSGEPLKRLSGSHKCMFSFPLLARKACLVTGSRGVGLVMGDRGVGLAIGEGGVWLAGRSREGLLRCNSQGLLCRCRL
jgi:hypothetical protein